MWHVSSSSGVATSITVLLYFTLLYFSIARMWAAPRLRREGDAGLVQRRIATLRGPRCSSKIGALGTFSVFGVLFDDN